MQIFKATEKKSRVRKRTDERLSRLGGGNIFWRANFRDHRSQRGVVQSKVLGIHRARSGWLLPKNAQHAPLDVNLLDLL